MRSGLRTVKVYFPRFLIASGGCILNLNRMTREEQVNIPLFSGWILYRIDFRLSVYLWMTGIIGDKGPFP